MTEGRTPQGYGKGHGILLSRTSLLFIYYENDIICPILLLIHTCMSYSVMAKQPSQI